MNKKIKIAGLCGSLRSGSFNKKILNMAAELMPENMKLEIVDFEQIPYYNEDLDTETTTPKSVTEFRQKLTECSGFFIVSPEYNYSIPGGLKNALDWASRGANNPLSNKPVSLMGATLGMWGTSRMQTAFLPIFHLLNMRVVKPEILINSAHKKFDENGNFNDDFAKNLIKENLENLKKAVL